MPWLRVLNHLLIKTLAEYCNFAFTIRMLGKSIFENLNQQKNVGVQTRSGLKKTLAFENIWSQT